MIDRETMRRADTNAIWSVRATLEDAMNAERIAVWRSRYMALAIFADETPLVRVETVALEAPIFIEGSRRPMRALAVVKRAK